MTDEAQISSSQPSQEIRWFWRGVRDGSEKPQPVWFSREEGQGHVWKPLRKNDCDAINRAVGMGPLFSNTFRCLLFLKYSIETLEVENVLMFTCNFYHNFRFR